MAPAAVSFSIDPYFRQRLEVMPAPDEGCLALVAESALRVINNKSVARSSPKQPSDNPVRQISDAVTGHLSTPLGLHPKTYGADMKTANETITRTKQHCTEWLKDKPAIKKKVASCLEDFPRLKVVARHAEASPRTVEAWTDQLSLPGLEYFLRLVPHSPSIQKMLLQLMTFDPDHPEYARILNDLRGMAR